jgi:hypothetical protein
MYLVKRYLVIFIHFTGWPKRNVPGRPIGTRSDVRFDVSYFDLGPRSITGNLVLEFLVNF